MKVTIARMNGDDPIDERMEMIVDGETVLNVGNMAECPEDANLGRDLAFVEDIPELLVKAHEAGKRGEELEFETLTEE